MGETQGQLDLLYAVEAYLAGIENFVPGKEIVVVSEALGDARSSGGELAPGWERVECSAPSTG